MTTVTHRPPDDDDLSLPRSQGSATHAYHVARHLARRLDDEERKLELAITDEAVAYRCDVIRSLWALADVMAEQYGYRDLRVAIRELRGHA